MLGDGMDAPGASTSLFGITVGPGTVHHGAAPLTKETFGARSRRPITPLRCDRRPRPDPSPGCPFCRWAMPNSRTPSPHTSVAVGNPASGQKLGQAADFVE